VVTASGALDQLTPGKDKRADVTSPVSFSLLATDVSNAEIFSASETLEYNQV